MCVYVCVSVCLRVCVYAFMCAYKCACVPSVNVCMCTISKSPGTSFNPSDLTCLGMLRTFSLLIAGRHRIGRVIRSINDADNELLGKMLRNTETVTDSMTAVWCCMVL
jgi:hypothetical protein